MSRMTDIMAAHGRTQAVFDYVSDEGEDWRDQADKVIQGLRLPDDCDGSAIASGTICYKEYSIPPEDIYLLAVATTPGKQMNHLICCVYDDNGVGWVLENQRADIYPFRDLTYEVIKFVKMSQDITSEWYDYVDVQPYEKKEQ